jgi:hypothetical protein
VAWYLVKYHENFAFTFKAYVMLGICGPRRQELKACRRKLRNKDEIGEARRTHREYEKFIQNVGRKT